MVKEIKKTYSVDNGKVTKTVTWSSTEEQLSSQSSASYGKLGSDFYLSLKDLDARTYIVKPTNAPAKYGADINDGIISGVDKLIEGMFAYQTDKDYNSSAKYDAPVNYQLDNPCVYVLACCETKCNNSNDIGNCLNSCQSDYLDCLKYVN